MIVVISCTSGKRKRPGSRLKTKGGKLVEFVAHPEIAPQDQRIVYKHPDCESGYGGSWRKMLKEYNNDPNASPLGTLGLFKAWELYRPQRKAYREIYDELANTFEQENVYILSAGWGLIRSDFLTPYYDITFSPNSNIEAWKRRDYEKSKNKYNDLCQIPEGIEDPIVFMGGDKYVQPFIDLTRDLDAQKVIFFYSKNNREKKKRYSSEYDLRVYCHPAIERMVRVWYYQCARDLIEGKIKI